MVSSGGYSRKLTTTNITFAKYGIWTRKITNVVCATKVPFSVNNQNITPQIVRNTFKATGMIVVAKQKSFS